MACDSVCVQVRHTREQGKAHTETTVIVARDVANE